METISIQVKPGLALRPTTTADVSPAAPVLLAASIAASPKSYQIATLPRGVIDQGKLLCCVSCALASALEATHPAWPALAPLFHYYVTQKSGGADIDGSLFLESGLAALAAPEGGICLHDFHPVPFTPAGKEQEPSAEAYADALGRVLARIGKRARWLHVSGRSAAEWMRDQLDQDRPVVIAFQAPAGYPGDKFLKPEGVWRDPNAVAANGHCALVVGYSDIRRAFHVQDSRGAGSFQRGCWWMGYTIVDSPAFLTGYSFIR